MPSLDPLHPQHSAIVEVLSRKTGSSVKQLQRALAADHDVKISLPNLYRTVRHMTDVQILVRTKGKISLSLVWITHLMQLADVVRGTYHVRKEDLLDFPLKLGEERIFHADSLLALDPIWSHILAKLATIERSTPWYIYNSHPDYSLGMRDTETRGYQSYIAQGVKCHLLYGNDTFLDRYGAKLIRVPGFQTAFAEGKSPFGLEGHDVWSCGEYVVECHFPASINGHFRFFYQNVQSIEQFDADLFADVFRMKARCTLSVRRNAKEAAAIREKLKPFFRSRAKHV